jgi:hypothetical protein
MHHQIVNVFSITKNEHEQCCYLFGEVSVYNFENLNGNRYMQPKILPCIQSI